MGVTEDDLPILKAFVPTKEYKYECDTKPQQLSLDLILKFGRDILQRKISPSLKS
jgi:protein disulfide-isomerase A1